MRRGPDYESRPEGCHCGGSETTRKARRLVRWLAVLALAGVAAAGTCARADDLVLEASFLSDPVPAEGTDLNLALGLSPGPAEDARAQPRAQLATRLAPGLGLAVDGGLMVGPAGETALAPFAASLKLALADASEVPGGVALHASVDLQAEPLDWAGSEAGLGLGLSRRVGPVTLRGGVWGMSAVGRWDPHAHAGLSAALPLGARARLLVEAVADLRGAGSALGAGPTLKMEVAPGTTISAGALMGVAPWSGPTAVLVQVGRSL